MLEECSVRGVSEFGESTGGGRPQSPTLALVDKRDDGHSRSVPVAQLRHPEPHLHASNSWVPFSFMPLLALASIPEAKIVLIN